MSQGGICLQHWGSLRTSSQFLLCCQIPGWKTPASHQCEGKFDFTEYIPHSHPLSVAKEISSGSYRGLQSTNREMLWVM